MKSPMSKMFGLMAAGAILFTAAQVDARLFEAKAAALADPSCGCESACECAPKCCYNPCIEYRHVHRWKKACCGCGTMNMVLTVEDPCKCGCARDVPVCIPCCCTGEPCVKSRCGLLGRGVVTYEWCCGYKLTVAFKKCGDVVVTYFGS